MQWVTTKKGPLEKAHEGKDRSPHLKAPAANSSVHAGEKQGRDQAPQG